MPRGVDQLVFTVPRRVWQSVQNTQNGMTLSVYHFLGVTVSAQNA
jgi:hypothetical protein